MQHIQDDNVEHMYHVLETPHYPSKPQHLNGTGKTTPDPECLSLIKPDFSTTAEQVLIYQDVAKLCPSIKTANEAMRIGHDPETLSSSKQGKQLVVPVYQEIAELSTERADSSEQNTRHIYAEVLSAGTNI